MQHAHLYGADLSQVDLSNAHLEGTHFCDADKKRPAKGRRRREPPALTTSARSGISTRPSAEHF
jgi:uncharacterized protein YjbI with pentapeptide repeats